MHTILYRPRKPEETERDEDGADIGEREAVFGFGFAVVSASEGVVDSVDFGNEEADGEQETEAGTEVGETDLGGGEAIAVAVDGLEVCVKAVGCGKEDSLVDGHCKDDGLGEEDFEGAFHAGCEFCGEGTVVLVGYAVFLCG